LPQKRATKKKTYTEQSQDIQATFSTTTDNPHYLFAKKKRLKIINLKELTVTAGCQIAS